jgi:hypothetical protein
VAAVAARGERHRTGVKCVALPHAVNRTDGCAIAQGDRNEGRLLRRCLEVAPHEEGGEAEEGYAFGHEEHE